MFIAVERVTPTLSGLRQRYSRVVPVGREFGSGSMGGLRLRVSLCCGHVVAEAGVILKASPLSLLPEFQSQMAEAQAPLPRVEVSPADVAQGISRLRRPGDPEAEPGRGSISLHSLVT